MEDNSHENPYSEKIKLLFLFSKQVHEKFKGLTQFCFKIYKKGKKIQKKYDRKLREKRKKQFYEKKKRANKKKASSLDSQQQKSENEKHYEKKKNQKEEKIKKTKKIEKVQKVVERKPNKQQAKKNKVFESGSESEIQPPKKPAQPYFQFLKHKKNEMKAYTHNYAPKQISSLLQHLWKQLSDAERRPYIEIYSKQKIEYERKRFEYHQKHGDGKKSKKGKSKQNKRDFLDDLDLDQL